MAVVGYPRRMVQVTENTESLYSQAHSFSFSEKTKAEFIKEFFAYFGKEAGTFLATAITLWAMAEVLAAATDGHAPIGDLAVPVLVVALIVTVYRAYRKQQSYVPEVLSSESSAVKRMFRQQRCGWNAALARQMLIDRIGEAEATLERIELGAEYVQPRRVEQQEYITWLQTRPTAMLRLVRSAMILVTSELPAAISRGPKLSDSRS